MDRLSRRDEALLLNGIGVTPDHIRLVSQYPMDETSGDYLRDRISANNAPIVVPSWTIPTHEFDRRGILTGSNASIEWSNGGPQIAMIPAYQTPGVSIVLWIEPRGDLRGRQYWDDTSELHHREVIAHCDDGSTPGGFCLYRRCHTYEPVQGAHDVRLGGWVRNSGGSKTYFGGGLSGVSGAQLPLDTAVRIALSQGPAGAKLFLDDSEVATLPSVTQSWSSLSTPILLGCSDEIIKPYLRSPYLGRVDNVEIWAGQMALADVVARPSAVQSPLYKIPTDFGLYTIGQNATVQQDLDAAAAAQQYLYQDPDDATVRTVFKDADPTNTCLYMKPNCPGIIGVKLIRNGGAANAQWNRMLNVAIGFWGGQMTDNRFAAQGGYKFIGLRLDGNARAMDWHPWDDEPGYSYNGQHPGTQQAPIFVTGSQDGDLIDCKLDACELFDGTGDGSSMYLGATVTVESTRIFSTFRGGLVHNNNGASYKVKRCELFRYARHGINWAGQPVGSGIDMEPFEKTASAGSAHVLADLWSEDDCEISIRASTTGTDTASFYNMHFIAGGILHTTTGDHDHSQPVDVLEAHGCTFCMSDHGGDTTGNYPPSWIHSLSGTDGRGSYFQDCVFMINGDQYNYHNQWVIFPKNTWNYGYTLTVSGVDSGPRWMTLVDSELRVKNLPAGTPTSNVRMFVGGSLGSSYNMYLDGVTVDAAFADNAWDMAGMVVNYRDVIHERTGSTTPWNNSGGNVPI